ncbi:uncharacterized protein LOC144572886 isoform X2 [Carex rostrata]
MSASLSVPDSPSPPTSPEADSTHHQPPPNSPSLSSSSLAWYYIIQTLADCKADLPLLKELINRLPNFYTHAPQSVLERLALRYLEEYTSRCIGRDKGIVDTKDDTAGATAIDISQPTLDSLSHTFKRLKESVLGPNAKLHSTRENGSSSSHRQKDNVVDDEHEMITSPRSGGTLGPMHNDASQNLSSQNALDADKTTSEPLQENNPTTIGNVSNLEAARSEPLSDDMNKFILKRRDAEPKTSVEEPKEPIPETSIPIEPSRNENDNNLRSNADFRDDASDCERIYLVDKNGKRKEKHVKSNDRNVSKDRDILGGRGEEAKKREADSAFARLDKYIHVKSGPGATSGNHEAVPMNEEMGNERRREYRINADAKNRKKRRPTPRYSNKVAGPRRRNMLPWSAEEENALREGMKKIGVTVDGRIPWSSILELYPNVFHKTRIPIDLKDKWRNIMKKEERVDS